MLFAPSKLRYTANNCIKDLSNTSDHIQIKNKIQNPSLEPPASSNIPNHDLKYMDVVGTFKIKIVTIWNLGVSKTNEHIKIQIKMPNPSQEPPAYSKALNKDLKDMIILCNFKVKIESQNLEHGCIKNPVNISKLRSSCQTSVRILQRPFKPPIRAWRTWWSLHLQIMIEGPNLESKCIKD